MCSHGTWHNNSVVANRIIKNRGKSCNSALFSSLLICDMEMFRSVAVVAHLFFQNLNIVPTLSD